MPERSEDPGLHRIKGLKRGVWSQLLAVAICRKYHGQGMQQRKDPEVQGAWCVLRDPLRIQGNWSGGERRRDGGGEGERGPEWSCRVMCILAGALNLFGIPDGNGRAS